ncbi:MAG: aspartate--tRNA ligase [Limnochordia bacterium]|jgi:aspartyl-tRNA synthetase
MRSHVCGELRVEHVGQRVKVAGWVHRRRDHGGLIFVDLRDRWGIVQVVFSPERGGAVFERAERLRNEHVLMVEGEVTRRLEGMENPNLATGDIEVLVDALTVFNEAKTPPFQLDSRANEVDEMLRLRYRYLDLRRFEMQETLILRHRVVKAVRDFLDGAGFLEIETPMLTKSTPEGARDYLVPSRVHPGEFFALPQSPQLFKQLLMMGGLERYFQITRCFRDEDLRADRQPEFTQIDCEMSFVERTDVMRLVERMVAQVFAHTIGVQVELPIPCISWQDAMDLYGSDKPDLRFGLPLVDVSEEVAGCAFRVFSNVVRQGGQVKGINAKGAGRWPRREIDQLEAVVTPYGAKGLVWMVVGENGDLRSPVAKFLTAEEIGSLIRVFSAEPGDLLCLVAGPREMVAESLGRLRLYLGERLGLIDHTQFKFAWVTEWPLLEREAETGRWSAAHHPFTCPVDEDVELLSSDPGKVRAKAYDLVLNGVELGGGSIRIHCTELQARVFEVLGISDSEMQEKFGFLLEALQYGAPPHGGIALGLDRMVMLMAGRDSIRDCIAFPKTQSATDLMMQAPGRVAEAQLRELHIRLAPEARVKDSV